MSETSSDEDLWDYEDCVLEAQRLKGQSNCDWFIFRDDVERFVLSDHATNDRIGSPAERRDRLLWSTYQQRENVEKEASSILTRLGIPVTKETLHEVTLAFAKQLCD